MAAKRKPPTKAESLDISARLAESLAQRPKVDEAEVDNAPQIGDQVTVGKSEMVYTVLSVADNGRDVRLHVPGMNLERFRVPVGDLHFVNRAPRKPKEPEKPKIDVEEIHERLVNAQHDSIQQLSGDIAMLKKYLKSEGIPAEVIEELDKLCKELDDIWGVTLATIVEKLEE